jgi:hypothetical protein
MEKFYGCGWRERWSRFQWSARALCGCVDSVCICLPRGCFTLSHPLYDLIRSVLLFYFEGLDAKIYTFINKLNKYIIYTNTLIPFTMAINLMNIVIHLCAYIAGFLKLWPTCHTCYYFFNKINRSIIELSSEFFSWGESTSPSRFHFCSTEFELRVPHLLCKHSTYVEPYLQSFLL